MTRYATALCVKKYVFIISHPSGYEIALLIKLKDAATMILSSDL